MAEERILSRVDDIMQVVDAFVTQGVACNNISGLSEKDREAIYSIGLSYYNSGRYENAQGIFSLFMTFPPLFPFLLTLGYTQSVPDTIVSQYPCANEYLTQATDKNSKIYQPFSNYLVCCTISPHYLYVIPLFMKRPR